MYGYYGTKMIIMTMIVLSVCLLSGCIKGRSDVVVEEMEFCAATEMTITNSLGNVQVNGLHLNNHDGVIFVRTEKYVDTYSLFGLGSPNEYMDLVMSTPVIRDGVLSMNVELRRRSLFDRLFVRVVPNVNRIVEAPTLIATTAEVQIGDLELRNMPGDVNATVNAGKVTVDSPLGILGEQQYNINIGELAVRLPRETGFRYDIAVDIGDIELEAFGAIPQRRFMGRRASGLAGFTQTPGAINAQVNIGTVAVVPR